MAAKRTPAPAMAGREWSCGHCAPGASGLCHDRHGKCRDVWAGFAPATEENPGGEVLCACAAARHPKEAVVTIVPVDVVELPEIIEEVA